MSTLFSSQTFRRFLLGLLAFAVQLSACQAIARHAPSATLAAEAERHAELKQQSAAHGHIHDDGDDGERVRGHVHGHNPADHSHDTPIGVAQSGVDIPLVQQGWPPQAGPILSGRNSDPMDRPPEYLSSM